MSYCLFANPSTSEVEAARPIHTIGWGRTKIPCPGGLGCPVGDHDFMGKRIIGLIQNRMNIDHMGGVHKHVGDGEIIARPDPQPRGARVAHILPSPLIDRIIKRQVINAAI